MDEMKFKFRHQLQHGAPWVSPQKQTNSFVRGSRFSLPKLFLPNIFSKLVIICDYLEGKKKGHIYLKKNLSSKNYGTVERRKHDPYPSTEI